MVSRESLEDSRRKLLKALLHLEYSFAKVQALPTDAIELDEERLETWESFTARFSRCVDLFLVRYLRARLLHEDPGFSGTLRDAVNQGEKLGLVDDARAWLTLRELRNIAAHEYSEQDLGAFYERLRQEAPRILALEARLGKDHASD